MTGGRGPRETGAPAASIRPATAADLPTIVRHRRCMFVEMGQPDPPALDVMEATATPYLETALEIGSYRGWLAELGGRVVAGGGVTIAGFPPVPGDHEPRRAWILNVYTEPEFRGRGLARRLMEAMIAWCRAEGFRVVSLHASDAGRPLYEAMGFKATNEMRLDLE